MIRTAKILMSMSSFMILWALLPSFEAKAIETDDSVKNANEYDSMYRYNALEANVAFNNFGNKTDDFKKSLPISIELSDNTTKELQDITEKQDFSTTQIENAIKVLKDRSEIKTFLIGNNLGTLKFQLVQVKDQAYRLNALALKNQDNINKIQIDNQVAFSKAEQLKVEDFIREQKNKFSLFGWLVNTP